MNQNILFVSDVHLSPRTPSSRKDDYPNTLLTKLSSLLDLAKQNNVSDIFFLGDVFNAKHMTLQYFIKCYDVFKSLSDSGIKLHTIIGNHDILYDNESTMDDSPMHILLTSGIVDNTHTVTINNITVFQANYLTNIDTIPHATNTTKYNILTGHYFYHLGFGDLEHTLSKEKCDELGYNFYILGHDHTPYEPLVTKNYTVLRPGSFSRGTSDTCHINRDSIKVVLMNSYTSEYSLIDVPNVLPASDVYKEQVLIDKVTMSDISESLKDFLSSLTFDNSSDIFATLNTIPMSDEIRDLLISYLNNEGIYDNTQSQGGATNV